MQQGRLRLHADHRVLDEYPGSKNTTWLAAPETGRTWRFCAQTEDPNELPSTLDNTVTIFEFRVDGMTGPLLATGEFISPTCNQIAVRYDPVTQMAGASINGFDLGSYPVALPGTPKFVGFEGVGILDNFVVTQLP